MTHKSKLTDPGETFLSLISALNKDTQTQAAFIQGQEKTGYARTVKKIASGTLNLI